MMNYAHFSYNTKQMALNINNVNVLAISSNLAEKGLHRLKKNRQLKSLIRLVKNKNAKKSP